MSLTLDDVEFKEFGQVIGPYLRKGDCLFLLAKL